MINIDDLIDVPNGTQAKRIFWDREIYELELKHIFGRCWLFLTHDSLIPDAGDYTAAVMGEDEVIVVRQRDGTVKVFLNYCQHRGARLCVAEAGNARSFTCSYHGWAYGMNGALVAVPFEQELYQGCLNKESLGLRQVRAESYHGFWYGCFDAKAPSLHDYLGDMRWYLDIWMEANGGVELIGPPQRSLLKCNWKTPAENFVGDMYHVGWTHAASLKVMGGTFALITGNQSLPPPEYRGVQVTTRFGHGASIVPGGGVSLVQGELLAALSAWQTENTPRVAAKMGDLAAKYYCASYNSTIFPNNTYLWGAGYTFKLWTPRGPHQLEVWTWPIVENDMPSDLKRAVAEMSLRTFGTAGTLEADDTDNFESMTQLNRGPQTRRGRMTSVMGLGSELDDPDHPGIISPSGWGETSYRGFYRAYREFLAAFSWDEMPLATQQWKREILPERSEHSPDSTSRSH